MSQNPHDPLDQPDDPEAGATAEPPAPEVQDLPLLEQVQAEMRKIVIGQDSVLQQLVTCLIAGGHALLEGMPGMGKTLIARALVKTFDGQFGRIQFTPDLMPADIIGYTQYNQHSGEFSTRQGPVFTNLLLADEINRAPAKTQAALLEAMQEYQVTIDGTSQPLPKPFMTVATQNPIELEGTYPLPEAQLDRFLMKILIDYPAADDELSLVNVISRGQASEAFSLQNIRSILSAADILNLQQEAASLEIDQRVLDYAVRVVRETRQWPGIAYGASPRAAIALVRAARAGALLNQRVFVIPDDIKQIAPAVLRHRIKLTPEFEIEGQSPDQVISQLLMQVEAPRQ